MFEFFATYFLYFLAYSFFGWFFEVCISLVRLHKFVNRGFLNGPYCPIYGVGALIFLQLQLFTTRPIELFFIGAIAACSLEYFVSWLMEKLFKARWWDYSEWPLHINGRVCLYGFLAFGGFSAILPYIHAPLSSFILSIPTNIKYPLAIILAIFFIIDIATSNAAMAQLNKMLQKYQKHFKLPIFIEKQLQRGREAFTFQQRRILKAFPYFSSIKYAEPLKRLQKINEKAKKQFEKTKFKPMKKA